MTAFDDLPTRELIGRRRFLRRTLFGVAALSAARLLPSAYTHAGVPQTVSDQLTWFSEKEYLVVSAVSARLTGHAAPGSSPDKGIDVALRADRFLATEDPEIQEQIHLLLTLFNSAFVAAVLEFKFSSFLDMGPEEKDEYLEGWMTSGISFRRTAFQALKRLCMSMHYTDARSSEEIGYHGMFMPEDRR
jgi:hypothetical protein